MIFFRYTRFLESENQHLKDRIESLETRNQELVIRMFDGVSPLNLESPKPVGKAHSIETKDTRSSCSCGWTFVSEDPGVMQNAISSHYRDSTISMNRRKSWVTAKAALEGAAKGE